MENSIIFNYNGMQGVLKHTCRALEPDHTYSLFCGWTETLHMLNNSLESVYQPSDLCIKMEKERTFEILTDEEYAKAFTTFKQNSDENNTIRHAIIQPIIKAYAGKSIDMMSIGAGDGWLEDEIIRHPKISVKSILAIEPNYEHARKLQATSTKWDDAISNIDVSYFDENYETSKRFDVILMVHSIYYQQSPIKAIIKTKSYLKPGGVLIIAIVGKNGGHQLATRVYEQMNMVPAFCSENWVSSKFLVDSLINNAIKFHIQTFNSSHDVTDFIKKKGNPNSNDTITFFLNTKYETLDSCLQEEVYSMVNARSSLSNDNRHLFPEEQDFIFIENV